MPSLDSIHAWVLAGSLRASLLTLIILGLQFLLRKHLSARWRHGLWLPALIVLILPASTQSRWSPASILVKAAPTPPVLRSSAPVQEIPIAPITTPLRQTAPIPWKRLSVALWAGGALGLGVLSLLIFRMRLRTLLRLAQPTPPELTARIADLARETGLKQPPCICITPAVDGPAVCGLWNPTLLLPPQFAAQPDTTETSLVLRHELLHLRRGDLWLHALLWTLLAIHWFNPVLWLAFFRVRMDREAACDADVLRDATPEHRVAYGHALLKLESESPGSGLCLGFVGIVQRGTSLRSRLELIAFPTQTPLPMKTLLLAVSTALTFLGVTKAADTPQKSTGSGVAAASPAISVESVFYQIPEDSIPADLRALAGPETLSGPFSQEQLQKLTADLQKTADVLSAPRVITRLGQKATIEIMSDTVIGSKTEPLGVRLSVTPTMPEVPLGKEPVIELDLQPAVRSLDETSTTPKVLEQSTHISTQIGNHHAVLISLGTRKDKVTREEQSGASFSRKTSIVAYRTLVAITATAVDADGTPHSFSPSIEEKLDSIVIPQVEFKDAPPTEAVQYLREVSRKLDTSFPAEQRGVNIVLHLDKQKSDHTNLTMSLRAVPLREVLRYVAELAGLQTEITPHAVLLRNTPPRETKSPTVEITADEVESASGKTIAKGNVSVQTPSGTFKGAEIEFTPSAKKSPAPTLGGDILLPIVDFRNATLEEALEFIRQQSRKLDPSGRGAQILIQGSPRTTPITLSLRNVPVSAALRYVAQLCAMGVVSDSQAFILRELKP